MWCFPIVFLAGDGRRYHFWMSSDLRFIWALRLLALLLLSSNSTLLRLVPDVQGAFCIYWNITANVMNTFRIFIKALWLWSELRVSNTMYMENFVSKDYGVLNNTFLELAAAPIHWRELKIIPLHLFDWAFHSFSLTYCGNVRKNTTNFRKFGAGVVLLKFNYFTTF